MTPKYLPELAAQAAQSIGQPGLHHVSVLHDDWCRLIAGKGPCNCNPIVKPAVSHQDWKRRN